MLEEAALRLAILLTQNAELVISICISVVATMRAIACRYGNSCEPTKRPSRGKQVLLHTSSATWSQRGTAWSSPPAGAGMLADPLLAANLSAHATGNIVRLSPHLASEFTSALPLLWLVNICWPPCGFCQQLQPVWERLACRLRHEVVVSFWDVRRRPLIPAEIGTANSTPTIRAIVPGATGGIEGRRFIEYQGTRRYDDLLSFALGLMPNFVARVESEEAWVQATEQASATKLPRLLCFLGIAADVETPPMLKALSANFRDHLIVTDVRVHESAPTGWEIAARFGVNALPSFVALRGGAWTNRDQEPWRLDGPPTFRRLSDVGSWLTSEAARSGPSGHGSEPAQKEEL